MWARIWEQYWEEGLERPQDEVTVGTVTSLTAGMAGLLPGWIPVHAPYSAAKAGVEGLTRALAVEWACNGIRVNAIAPGWIYTRLVRANLESGRSNAESILNHIPLRRFGEPNEIADAVEFLATARSSYITGQVLVIDGGATIAADW